MNFEDAKIWNARFTLLHTAIQELSGLRAREYDNIDFRIKLLETQLKKTNIQAATRGAICGFVAGILGSIIIVAFIYFWEME